MSASLNEVDIIMALRGLENNKKLSVQTAAEIYSVSCTILAS
jgi:hypothetical protein